MCDHLSVILFCHPWYDFGDFRSGGAHNLWSDPSESGSCRGRSHLQYAVQQQSRCQKAYGAAQGTNIASGVQVKCPESSFSCDTLHTIKISVLEAVHERSGEVTTQQGRYHWGLRWASSKLLGVDLFDCEDSCVDVWSQSCALDTTGIVHSDPHFAQELVEELVSTTYSAFILIVLVILTYASIYRHPPMNLQQADEKRMTSFHSPKQTLFFRGCAHTLRGITHITHLKRYVEKVKRHACGRNRQGVLGQPQCWLMPPESTSGLTEGAARQLDSCFRPGGMHPMIWEPSEGPSRVH